MRPSNSIHYRLVNIARDGWWIAEAAGRRAYFVGETSGFMRKAFEAFSRSTLSSPVLAGQWIYFYYDIGRDEVVTDD